MVPSAESEEEVGLSVEGVGVFDIVLNAQDAIGDHGIVKDAEEVERVSMTMSEDESAGSYPAKVAPHHLTHTVSY